MSEQKGDKFCAICDDRLNVVELNSIKLHDFQVTCGLHRQYASYFQVGKVRRELGYPDNTNYICAICDKPLNEEEKESVTENQFWVTCEKHRKGSRFFILDMAKQECGFATAPIAGDNPPNKKT